MQNEQRINVIADLDRYYAGLSAGHGGLVGPDILRMRNRLAAGEMLSDHEMDRLRAWLRELAADDALGAHPDEFLRSHGELHVHTAAARERDAALQRAADDLDAWLGVNGNAVGADRIAERLARQGKVDAVRLEEDNVVKILEQHRPDWFLLFGTWAGCQDALITASRLGIQVRFIKG